jgi:protein-tyrosine-phosphatase
LTKYRLPGKGFAMKPHILFVCVGNRVRSVFAEFFLMDFFGKRDLKIAVSSAGFLPQKLKDHLAENRIASPEPFYNRPMSEVTMDVLRDKGIHIPEGWRSKELNLEMINTANLLITALGMQKDELSDRYENMRHKIFSIRELLKTEDYLFFEDFTKVPLNANFWQYCEEDPEYVTKVLRTWEETISEALPNIIKQL